MTFGLHKKYKDERNVLIFDLGGGKLNITLLSIVEDIYEAKATAGDLNIGGEDFDNILLEWCASEF